MIRASCPTGESVSPYANVKGRVACIWKYAFPSDRKRRIRSYR